MTTIKAPASLDTAREIQTHLSSQFDILKNKTDNKAQNTLFQNDLFQASPVKKAKLEFQGDFPISPLSLALAPNARIAKIAFPASPPRSPSKEPYDTGPTPYRSPVSTRIPAKSVADNPGTGDSAREDIPATTLPAPEAGNSERLCSSPAVSTPSQLKRRLFSPIPAFSEERKVEMPLPNLPLPSFPTEIQTTKTQAPPPTPCKKQRTGAPVSVFKKQHDALTSNIFKYDVTYLAKGSYSNVYTFETTPFQVIPGVDNSTLVLKAFHGGKEHRFVEPVLRGYLHTEIENYRAVVAAGLPVARIYNVDTAEQDGYIIQQKVSGKIDLMNGQQMLQVRRFFEISVAQGLIMDLTPQNFALENGQVVLFDFVEEQLDDGIDIFNKNAIETWLDYYRQAGGTRAQAAAFLNGLSANHYQGYVQELSPSSPD